jgi:hypothetical protein
MAIAQIFALAGAIVSVGLVTVLVTNKNTAGVISAIGSAFGNALKAAMGK